jgi:hypothetical protein
VVILWQWLSHGDGAFDWLQRDDCRKLQPCSGRGDVYKWAQQHCADYGWWQVRNGAGPGGGWRQEVTSIAARAGAACIWTLAREVGWWGDLARVYIASLLGDEQRPVSRVRRRTSARSWTSRTPLVVRSTSKGAATVSGSLRREVSLGRPMPCHVCG